MDKSKHTVTVPREYIEKLEGFFEAHKEAEHNIFGKIFRTSLSNNKTALFLDENEITSKDFSEIIIIDEKGSQKLLFKKI